MKLEFLSPYVHYIVYILIGIIVLYIRTLVIEKAKIRVLKKDNKKLIEETEQIKKEHLLDIEKRKYQYESKKEEYKKFFRLIDDFSSKSNIELQEKMVPLINEFTKNYMTALNQGNKKNETKATLVFSEKIQKLLLDSSSDLRIIRQETNTIRLIASDTIIQTINLLECKSSNKSELFSLKFNRVFC